MWITLTVRAVWHTGGGKTNWRETRKFLFVEYQIRQIKAARENLRDKEKTVFFGKTKFSPN